ncbi:MAG: CoA-binding protein [Acidimicrobiia bacterium]
MKDLTPLLSEPGTSIAVIGATDHPTKYGGIIYRDMKAKGFPVFAVNPYRDTVDGDPCWGSVTELPEKPSIAVFVLPAKRGLQVLEECAQAEIRNIWIQPGALSEELRQALDSGPFDWLAEACVMVRSRSANLKT